MAKAKKKIEADAAPTIGRQVRYVIGPGEIRTATIAKVHDDEGRCNLGVLKAEPGDLAGHPGVIMGAGAAHSIAVVGSVEYDADQEPGTWHWPEQKAPAAKTE